MAEPRVAFNACEYLLDRRIEAGDGVRVAIVAGAEDITCAQRRKRARHRHGSVEVVCDTYARQVLRITAADRCLSAAKAFFGHHRRHRPTPTLLVPSSSTADPRATGSWSRHDATRAVLPGEWLRTGDTYVRDRDGYYACLGRTDDMRKASARAG